jgi:hydroxymethylpyrimidine/phosphomethylpyrimidine kinase
MLFSEDLIRVVAGFLREHREFPVVVDPVMVATSGAVLLQQPAIAALENELLPLAALITPNLDEAAVLLGSRAESAAAMQTAAQALAQRYRCPVLLKGGHLEGENLIDVLATPGGEMSVFEDPRIHQVDTHGSGCTLAAAIAAGLSRGLPLPEAVVEGRAYLRRAMSQPVELNGRRFINHHV